MMRNSIRRCIGVSIGACLLSVPGTVRAWDPSTTHQTIVERGVLASELHVRLMEQTAHRIGLFSGIRLQPGDVPTEIRRTLERAYRNVHAASGAQGLGGPGACPPPGSPPETRTGCVEADTWEMTTLGWIQLGVVVETDPRSRLLHHFVDLNHPEQPTWSDRQLAKATLRTKYQRSGGAFAQRVNRTGFAGAGPSALRWLADESDPWAPPAIAEHLRQASLAATEAERHKHLALALIGIGAVLHVIQDLSVPAHARGDLTAFFFALSANPLDRGLPLQEFVRARYGRWGLPQRLAVQIGAATAEPAAQEPTNEPLELRLASSLEAHLMGDRSYEGLVHFAGRRFFSESTLPPPRRLDPALSPARAAAILLGDIPLADVERRGARLHPWPASSGYLITSTGRGLAAFDRDEHGRTRLFLDRRIYREQASHLIPEAIDVTTSIVNLLVPAFPRASFDAMARQIEIEGPPGGGVLTVLLERPDGTRTLHRTIKLRAGNQTIGEIAPAKMEPKSAVIVAVEHRRSLATYRFDPNASEPQKVGPVTPKPAQTRPAAPLEGPGQPATEDEPAAPTEIEDLPGEQPKSAAPKIPDKKDVPPPPDGEADLEPAEGLVEPES